MRTYLPEQLRKYGFLIITCPDPLNNHKATKPACTFWPSSARQRNAFSMAIIGPPSRRHLKRRFASELMMVVSDKQISILSNNLKRLSLQLRIFFDFFLFCF